MTLSSLPSPTGFEPSSVCLKALSCYLGLSDFASPGTIDYDRVLVLENGELVEFDTPRNLLRKDGGVFLKMCEQAPNWEELKVLAGM